MSSQNAKNLTRFCDYNWKILNKIKKNIDLKLFVVKWKLIH